MTQSNVALTDTLRRVRQDSRMSQLELSLRLGVSQRHVSFVESGRARPSRSLLVAWLRELESPLALRNAALLQAGFAPAYAQSRREDPALAAAQTAISDLLSAHDPQPALVLDALWNVQDINRGGRWLVGQLMPDLLAAHGDAPMNLLDALAHPLGPLSRVDNLDEVAPAFLSHIRREAANRPELLPRARAVQQRLEALLPGAVWSAGEPSGSGPPVLTTRYRTPLGRLSFFSMFTTFGTPYDITLESLRLEHFFAADDATRRILRDSVPG